MLTILNENQPVKSIYQSSFLGEENAIQPTSGWTRAQTFLGITLAALLLIRFFKWPHIYIKANPNSPYDLDFVLSKLAPFKLQDKDILATKYMDKNGNCYGTLSDIGAYRHEQFLRQAGLECIEGALDIVGELGFIEVAIEANLQINCSFTPTKKQLESLELIIYYLSKSYQSYKQTRDCLDLDPLDRPLMFVKLNFLLWSQVSKISRLENKISFNEFKAIIKRIKKNPEGFPLKGEEIPDDQFDPVQLAKGIQVELEHTDDAQVAKAIAKAHLLEDSDYYIKLENMETGRCDCLNNASFHY